MWIFLFDLLALSCLFCFSPVAASIILSTMMELGVPFDAFSFALFSPAEYASVLYNCSMASCDCVTVWVAVSFYVLCFETRVMRAAVPAEKWLQAFSAKRCNCQDPSLVVHANKLVTHKHKEKCGLEWMTFPSAPGATDCGFLV